jgi:thymidylate synthase (FAD)
MKNSVELIGYYGSDEIIACSAWTSTNRNLTDEKKQRIPKLIDMLWREGHHTPFEKADVHFLVNCDIASHIHMLKHRMSSLNAESARYKELMDDKYYLPKDWPTAKANTNALRLKHPTCDGVVIDPNWIELLEQYTKIGNQLYHDCLADLEPVVGRKRAKESARFFKTYNSQIQADVKFNLRSFANFLKLRASEHAQKEIREIAFEMLNLVSTIEGNPFKETLSAWHKYGVIERL